MVVAKSGKLRRCQCRDLGGGQFREIVRRDGGQLVNGQTDDGPGRNGCELT